MTPDSLREFGGATLAVVILTGLARQLFRLESRGSIVCGAVLAFAVVLIVHHENLGSADGWLTQIVNCVLVFNAALGTNQIASARDRTDRGGGAPAQRRGLSWWASP